MVKSMVVPFVCEGCQLTGEAEINLWIRSKLRVGPEARMIVGKCVNENCNGDLLVPAGEYDGYGSKQGQDSYQRYVLFYIGLSIGLGMLAGFVIGFLTGGVLNGL